MCHGIIHEFFFSRFKRAALFSKRLIQVVNRFDLVFFHHWWDLFFHPDSIDLAHQRIFLLGAFHHSVRFLNNQHAVDHLVEHHSRDHQAIASGNRLTGRHVLPDPVLYRNVQVINCDHFLTDTGRDPACRNGCFWQAFHTKSGQWSWIRRCGAGLRPDNRTGWLSLRVLFLARI